jgi:hypothetical protein
MTDTSLEGLSRSELEVVRDDHQRALMYHEAAERGYQADRVAHHQKGMHAARRALAALDEREGVE